MFLKKCRQWIGYSIVLILWIINKLHATDFEQHHEVSICSPPQTYNPFEDIIGYIISFLQIIWIVYFVKFIFSLTWLIFRKANDDTTTIPTWIKTDIFLVHWLILGGLLIDFYLYIMELSEGGILTVWLFIIYLIHTLFLLYFFRNNKSESVIKILKKVKVMCIIFFIITFIFSIRLFIRLLIK